ncbi:MAG: HAD-IB family hydrolase, partial [Acidimicrobiales bacterium]
MEAAFFDLDKTVIAKASMVAFSKTLYREGLISRWLLLRALYGQLVYLYLGADEERLARMKDAVLALTKGWEQDRVRAIVEEALTEVVDPIVYAEALELIHDHQAAGRKVFIVSASPEEIVAPLARHLRVDGFLGTRTEID